MPKHETVKDLVTEFVTRLSAAIEREARDKVLAALGGKAAANGATKRAKRTCPYPGCARPFSPRYSGWCADHRDLPAKEKARLKKEGKEGKGNGKAAEKAAAKE